MFGFSWQPIEKKMGPNGYDATIEELVRYIVVQSDNPSADVLLREVGGPKALNAWLESKGLEGIRVERYEWQMRDDARTLMAKLDAQLNRALAIAASSPIAIATIPSIFSPRMDLRITLREILSYRKPGVLA